MLAIWDPKRNAVSLGGAKNPHEKTKENLHSNGSVRNRTIKAQKY